MEMHTLRIISTVISFIAFVGIMVWVWRNRKNEDFKTAANLPFTEEYNNNTLPADYLRKK